MATTSSNRLLINLGAQANDGTGEAIRTAFDKVNQNFETIFNVAGIGSGLLFTKLADGPKVLTANKFIVTDATGLTVTQMTLTGANGIQITVDQPNKRVEINATITNLINDPTPILANNLQGANYRATIFGDPVDDKDLTTKKWIFDHFVNRDAQYEYISSTNPQTGANNTTTVVEGSTFRSNVRMVLTGTNTTTNVGKVITTYDYTTTGVTKTLDLTLGAWRESHLTRKDYVDTKISLQGIDTVDPETGQINPAFGAMTGPLYLSRAPTENDPANMAATKGYVDNQGFPSRQNFYVSLNGNDARYDIPPYKRGRSLAWAFRTINRAAQAALQYSKASQIKLGVYKRKITTNNYTDPVVINSILPSANIPNAFRIDVTYIGGNGTDCFIERSIRPGQYLLGTNSSAIGQILNLALEASSNVTEYYEIQYVDYADTFESPITPDAVSGTVTFRLFEPNLIEIPDFWVGYKFVIDSGAGGGSGVIQSVGLYYAPNGNVYDEITVKMDVPLIGTSIISGANWHVYSGYFEEGEELWYGQRYNKLEISLLVESGEYDEQLPIRIGDNISIKGDEFRRTIIKPAYVRGTTRYSISTSKWADIWFRRDTQVDGIIVVSLDETTDYATNTTVTPDGVTNDATTGVVTFSLGSGNANASWIKKVFVGAGGRGEITSVQGPTFTVNLAENDLGIRRINNTNQISPGSWNIYAPINFGYHYLRDPSRPVNYLASPNAGGYDFASKILLDNIDFIKAEVVGYIDAVYGGSFVYDQATCARDVGLIVDALAYDLKYGGINSSINAADFYYSARVNEVINNELSQTADAFGYINILAQDLFQQNTVTTTYSAVDQVIGTVEAEAGASSTIADLVTAMQGILLADPDFNPPKYNSEIDIFLMNDATMLRYLGANGHGGFMKVLDPEGQVKSKSPYTQTCSSFAQSKGRHHFAGGFFVDGFTGNLPLTTTSATAQSDTDGNLIYVPVSGVRRLPVFPTFFIVNGIKYEADYMLSYNSVAETGTLVLNPNNPGGIAGVSINSGNTQNEFTPNVATLPVTFSGPGTAGSLTARGYATTNAQGNIASIVVTFPGKGYVEQPTISLGGATFNFVIGGNGEITSMTINSGGQKYTTGTRINISAPGGVGLTASATIVSVDGNGAITAINLVSGGTGYVSTPTVTFGRQVFSSNIVKGFIGNLPSTVELITAGNRSMLANDFTQLNDLGYGIFATNGGFIENVSMFTYYCYTSYYALNGAILRTITGSSAYGTYGLVAEGSNPNEIPLPVTMPDDLSQIATVYNVAPYTNQKAGGDLYVNLSTIAGYAPYSNSEIEINHNGIRKTYSLRTARQVSGNFYALSLDTAGGGLYAAVANNTSIIIRIKYIWRLYGLNASSLTRPSTVLTLNEQSTYNYRILEYTNLGSDYVLAESDQSYDYVQITPYSQGGLYRQGVSRPTIDVAGTGYNSTSTQYGVTFDTPPTKTAVVNGAQGTIDAPVSTVLVGSASGQIHPGMVVTGGGALANQYVTWVSYDRTTIQTSQTQIWSTAGATLTFVGTTATGYALANGFGGIASVKITDPGVGYDTAPLVTIASAGGTLAQASVTLSGTSGTNVIKVLALNNSDSARITTGLSSSPVYNYVFGYEGETYKITEYKTPTQTGFSWGEISIQGYNTGTSVLTREMTVDPLYAGVSKNTNGSITVEISTLRATAHDMIDIGTGGYATSKIPNDLYGPPTIQPNQAQEVREIGKGRVYYVTTDQSGNFRVGKYFAVDQGRGTVTISAPISLTGISKLSFKKGVEVDEFSKDDTMAAKSLSKVPVESAIVSYIDHRLGVDKTGAVDAGLIGPGMMSLNGVLAMTGSLDMGTNKIINVVVPTSSSDGATKGYVDGKISLDGMDENTNDGGQGAGIMAGPLRLSADPVTITVTTTGTVSVSDTVVRLASSAGIYKGMQLNNSAFAGGTIVTDINNSQAITISAGATGSLPISSTIILDPVRQSATKRYVDRKTQFQALRDVVLTSQADTDILMFGATLTASSNTTVPLYDSARSVVNVANNTAAISNTSSANGGGSDVTLTRSGNSLTIKLVGGQGAANPITNHHINNAAAIAQSKLAMSAAGTASSSVGITQSSLGLVVFDQVMFSTANGFATLLTATNTTTGIAPSKMQWPAAGGGLLGATDLATSVAATYLSSSTVRTWLGVTSNTAGGTYTGAVTFTGGVTIQTTALDAQVNVTTRNHYAGTSNTYDIGTTSTYFRTMYVDTLYVKTGIGGSGAFINASTIPNSSLVNSSLTVSAGTGMSGGGSVGLGGSVTLTNNGVVGLTNGGHITATGTAGGTFTLGSDATNANTANTIIARDGSGNFSAGTMTGTATVAQYADLAERYTSDIVYEPGTVLVFGGAKEVTSSTEANDRRVAGVVSTNPAHLMNSVLEGIDVALTGRVPCKVVGIVKKGDLMVTSHVPGVAMANNDPKMGTVIGKALEDYNSPEVGVIEVVVGRM